MKKVLSVVIGTAILLSMLHVGKAMWIYGKAHLSYYLISSAWEETLNGGEQVKPWPWADTWPIAKLKVPKMGLSYFVLRGDSGRTLAFAPGHAVDSSEPGEPGVTLISGHRDTHFSFLKCLNADDELIIQKKDGKEIIYRVTKAFILNSDTEEVVEFDNKTRMLLMTCWPFDSIVTGGPKRYVVASEKYTQ
jgi:sortase A